jgi:hypothetical protein
MKQYVTIEEVMVDIIHYIRNRLTSGVNITYTICQPVVTLAFRDMESEGSETKSMLLSCDGTLATSNVHGVRKVSDTIMVDIVYHLSKNCWIVN